MQWAETKQSHDDTMNDPYEYKPRGMRNAAIHPHADGPMPKHNGGEAASVTALQNRILQARQRNVAIKRSIVEKNLSQNSQSQSQYRSTDQPHRDDQVSQSQVSHGHIKHTEHNHKELGSRKNQPNTSSQGELERPSGTGGDFSVGDADTSSMSRSSSKRSLKGAGGRRRRQSSDMEEKRGRNVSYDDDFSEEESGDEERGGGKERGEGRGGKEGAPEGKNKDTGRRGGHGRKKVPGVRNDVITSELEKIRDHMVLMIEDNRALMQHVTRSTVALGDADAEEIRREEQIRRQEMKSKIHNLLSRNNDTYRMPLWRHRLAGEKSPSPDAVMKGQQLFRMAALLVLYFYVKPRMSVHKRKQSRKNAEAESLLKNIMLFLDACGGWVGKAVKVPLASIVQVRCEMAEYSQM